MARRKGIRIRAKLKAPQSAGKDMGKAAEAMVEAFAKGLYQEGFAALALANSAAYVPVDTGRMRASGYVSPPERRGPKLVVELGYGVAYAIYVHERPELRHTVGQAFWLQRALEERGKGFGKRLAARAAKLYRMGGGGPPEGG